MAELPLRLRGLPRTIALLSALALLAGCGGVEPSSPEPTATALPPPASPTPAPTLPASATPRPATPTPTVELEEEPVMSTPSPEPTPPSGSGPLVEQARQDLAQRLDIAPAEIEVVSMESVVWPDSSLGCPQPGMAYTQVLRDGYRIQLRAGGKIYFYHGGGSRGPFLCENPAKPASSPGLGDT